MKLILENWRQYLNEQEVDHWDGDTGMPLTHQALKQCSNNPKCSDKWIHNPTPEDKAAMEKHRQGNVEASQILPQVRELRALFKKSAEDAKKRRDSAALTRFIKHYETLQGMIKKNDYAGIKKFHKDWMG